MRSSRRSQPAIALVALVGLLALGTSSAGARPAVKNAAPISVNAPTAGKVVVLREAGAIAGVKAACPNVQVIKVVTKATTDSTIQPFTDTLSRLPGKKHLLVTATNDDQTIGAIKAAQAV